VRPVRRYDSEMRALGLGLAACLVFGATLAPRPADASTADLVRQIDSLVKGFPGDSGIWISDPVSPAPLYTRNVDTEVITASLYKLGVLAEAERRVDAGELRYNDPVVIQPEDITADGSFEDAGTELTLDQALEAMITISDNGSARALWHILGGANVDQTLMKAGMPDFHVAFDDSEDNTATPRAIGTFFTLLARRQLVSPAASDRMTARLKRQKINNRLPAQLPDSVVIAHKTGNLAGIIHDAGIIYTRSGPRVVVTMTWDAVEEDADAFISSIGAMVYSAILEPSANARYQVPRGPILVETGGTARVSVPITNVGTRTWTGSGAGSVGLIWEARTSANQLVANSQRPQTLPPLQPNQTQTVIVSVNAPPQPADYRDLHASRPRSVLGHGPGADAGRAPQ
jgi:beta-lactamase class A